MCPPYLNRVRVPLTTKNIIGYITCNFGIGLSNKNRRNDGFGSYFLHEPDSDSTKKHGTCWRHCGAVRYGRSSAVNASWNLGR